jgi:hypothetical protein
MPNPRIYVAFSKAYFFPKKEVRFKESGKNNLNTLRNFVTFLV